MQGPHLSSKACIRALKAFQIYGIFWKWSKWWSIELQGVLWYPVQWECFVRDQSWMIHMTPLYWFQGLSYITRSSEQPHTCTKRKEVVDYHSTCPIDKSFCKTSSLRNIISLPFYKIELEKKIRKSLLVLTTFLAINEAFKNAK